MNRKQADYYMAGALGLMVVCTGLTLWLYQRYMQAADALDAARSQIHIVKGVLVMPKTPYTQATVDARLRTFLIMAVLTGLSAIGMAVVVLWHRKQRLRTLEMQVSTKKAEETVSG